MEHIYLFLIIRNNYKLCAVVCKQQQLAKGLRGLVKHIKIHVVI